MERFRLLLASIQKYMGQLGATQKMLAGSLVVIALMTLFLVSQYAGKPAWVELLPGAPAAEQQRALSHLQQAGLKAQLNKSGQIVVPPEQERQGLAQLTEAGKLPSDVSQLFRNILEKQTWYTSRQQSEQYYQIDLQNMLGTVIANFSGVRSATVVIDAPPAGGLGSSVRRPTASATVFMQAGRTLEQGTVDAIAGLIAGAKAGLPAESIRIIDGTSGRSRRATAPNDMAATTYLEHAAKVEAQTRDKLEELLAYIPGVIVAVTAQVDVTNVTASVKKNLERGEGTVSLPKSETTQKSNQSDSSKSSEPGVRSNTQADIAGGGSGRSTTEQEESTNEMENHVGQRVEQILDPRGMPTHLAASVNVPHSFIIGLLKASQAGAAPASAAAKPAEPAEADVEARFQIEKTKIAEAVRSHLKTLDHDGKLVEGDVSVAMIPVDVPMAPAASQAGILGGLASGKGPIGGMFDKVIVGVLAIFAVGMMLTMVRKAGRKLELPSAEELVGAPPPLESKSDVIGEADETETPMQGIEVGDDQMHRQKMLETVTELVGSTPEMAAKLVNRWIQVEE
jgi:flagellar biosynthesis/type III secretory pathway M-ring protein FliF/YscJ